MKFTTKQREILSHIIEANLDGSLLDLDQLLERTSYHPSKQAMNFSIRFLIEKGVIEKLPHEKRRGRSRTILGATPKGIAEAKGVVPLSSGSYVMSEDEAALLADIEAI